jgi:pimeloyl-ACP methyl ester carboxylesterase
MIRVRHLLLVVAWLAAPVCDTSAQDRPVVFLHGLFSKGDTWEEAAARLQGRHAIQAFTPTTDEGDRYDAQAAQVNQALGWLDGSAIAVGHSNGGLVARQWSQSHALGGIVTVGTPHFGAPLVSNLISYLRFGDGLVRSIWAVFDEFNQSCCDWRWILSNIVDTIFDAAGIYDLSIGEVLARLGLKVFHPVIPQMEPGSDFLQEINAPGTQARESAIPARVGVISVARNFYWGGPIRAALPEHADTLAAQRDFARDVLNYYAWY